MSLKKSNICIFSLNLEKFTPDRKFLHRHRLWCLWQIWDMERRRRNADNIIRYFHWYFTRSNVWYFGFLNIPSSSREGPEAGFRSYGERISRTGSFAVFAGTAWGEWSVRTASSDGDLIKSAFPLIAFTLLLNIKVLPPSHPKFIGHTIGSAYDKIFFLGGGRIFLLDLKIQRFR